jgi:uncharacterized protein YfaP (DUF2135 family)
MKLFSKSLILGLALLLASSAFAATKASLKLDNPATVNGTTLKPGDYTFQWDGTGPNVEVSIMQGKNVIAKVPAKVVDLPAKSQNDAVVTNGETIASIRFEGKKFALELGESGGGMGSSR